MTRMLPKPCTGKRDYNETQTQPKLQMLGGRQLHRGF